MTDPNLHYPHLFSPLTIRGVTLPNRAVMAPMSTELGGVEGEVTPAMIAFYRERALGGMGLIVVEYTCVDPDTGRAHEYQLTLESKRNLDGHRRLVRAIHDAGSKIFMQIQHSGQYANPKLLPDGMPVGPSDIFARKDPTRQRCRGLTSTEVEAMIAAFGETAGLAIEAGYDGVELHGAHGYLLTQFLSPLANRRDDEWGGDFERRLAFPMAVVRSVRAAIGDAPLVYRVSADEFRPGGMTIEDMERVVPHLVEAGVDAIHASTGWGVGEAFEKVVEPMSTEEGWRIPYAARLRKAAGVPVIAVGQIRWPETGEAAIANGSVDMIALGRPMLTDPEWANKAKAGRRDLIRPCTSCNWCISPHEGRVQVGCAENPRTGTELDPRIPSDLGTGRTAVVVGGGPGGSAAALLLRQSGFETHLFEAHAQAGGGIIASATPPGKDKLFWYSDFLRRRLDEADIRLHLSQMVSAQQIIAMHPDIVMLAAGTQRIDLPIAGSDHSSVMDAYDILMNEREVGVEAGGHVVVYGGGETGCETAEFCAHHGLKVTLVSRSPADKLARSADWVYRGGLLRRLHANPLITIVDNTHIVSVDDDGITLETNASDGAGQRVLKADRLLLAQGRKPDDRLAGELAAAGIAVTLIGDARQVGRIGDAVHMAYRAVLGLAAQYGKVTAVAC